MLIEKLLPNPQYRYAPMTQKMKLIRYASSRKVNPLIPI